jgi:hypothetical protein
LANAAAARGLVVCNSDYAAVMQNGILWHANFALVLFSIYLPPAAARDPQSRPIGTQLVTYSISSPHAGRLHWGPAPAPASAALQPGWALACKRAARSMGAARWCRAFQCGTQHGCRRQAGGGKCQVVRDTAWVQQEPNPIIAPLCDLMAWIMTSHASKAGVQNINAVSCEFRQS